LAFKLYENHRLWITLKVTDNKYGRLFYRQLGFFCFWVRRAKYVWQRTDWQNDDQEA